MIISVQGTAQKNVVFYENITVDSIMIFFNKNFQFTGKDCAEYIRRTRITSDGKYTGRFVDADIAGHILGKRFYNNGIKEGEFTVYHSNEKLRTKGSYLNDMPTGEWNFFYENGLPERTVMVSGKDTLLSRAVNEKGEVVVENGEGKFEGKFQLNGKPLLVKGTVKHGKADGKWICNSYCKEEYKEGKLIKGTFTAMQNPAYSKYTSPSVLNAFLQPDYFTRLEGARAVNCQSAEFTTALEKRKALNKVANEERADEMQKFKSELRPKVDKLLENDFKTGNTSTYVTGDNLLTIEFSVDEAGRATDFSHITSWGTNMFYPITNSIKNRLHFPPKTKSIFFHLKLHYPGGGEYSYSFAFSNDRSF